MSIEKRGKSWRVRWLQEGEHRSRTFSDYRQAKAFDLKMQSLKLEGRLRSAPRITLSEFAERQWFPEYVGQLADATQRNYRRIWDTHVAPREPKEGDSVQQPPVRPDALAARRLRELTNATIREFVAQLQGRTGAPMVRSTLMVLSSCLTYAVEVDYLDGNPVQAIRKPRASGHRKPVRPLPPEDVERLRAALLARPDGERHAALVSVLAYCGLRPGEALALRWRDVREKTIHVHQSLSFGIEKEPKNRRARSALLLPILRDELTALRGARGALSDALVFPRGDGAPFSDNDYRNWRRRIFRPAIEKSGLAATHPYALRHSWASLLLRSEEYGSNPARIADLMGHSVGTFFRVYAHEIEELRELPRVSPEAAIRSARAAATGQLQLLAG